MIEDDGPKLLMDRIYKIDKLEERQAHHEKEIEEIKKMLSSNEMDARLSKVEKQNEFILEEVKDYRKDFRDMREECNKQRTQCMASVAPLSFVADLKQDLKRMEERLQATYNQSRTESRDASDTGAKWTRWAFTLSLLACIVSSVSVMVCINIFYHLPK